MRASPPFSATAGWRTSRCPRLMTLSPNGATRATAGSSRRPPSWRTHRYWPAGWNWWTPRAPVRSTRTTPPRRKRSLSPWTRRCSCSPPTPPVSSSERELMARVAELSVTMFVVLNKADYLVGYDTTRGSLAEFSVAGAGDRGMDRAGGSGLGCAGVNGGSELGEALAVHRPGRRRGHWAGGARLPDVGAGGSFRAGRSGLRGVRERLYRLPGAGTRRRPAAVGDRACPPPG